MHLRFIQRMSILLSMLLISFLLSGCSKTDSTADALQTINAQQLSLSSLKEQWIVINYWASWCGPCREEIPELNEFQQENKLIKVIGVNYDNLELPALIKESKEMHIEFDVLTQDPSNILKLNRPNVLPTTLIFSPQLKLHKTLKGPQTKQDILDAIKSNNKEAK